MNPRVERVTLDADMDGAQLDLFADRAAIGQSLDSAAPPRVDPRSLSDAALIAALPDHLLSDACALAAEAGRRRLGAAVSALVALCNRFAGFGADCKIPEQAAALEALAAIGGADAARSVGRLIVTEVVQGPTLAEAAIAASQLGVTIPTDRAVSLLRHPDSAVRAAVCVCLRAAPEVVERLIELLGEVDPEVRTAAACALGRFGRGEALARLKACLNERPSPRVIEAVAAVADEEAVVFLARVARARPDLAGAVLSALDEIDHVKAATAASALRQWLSAATASRVSTASS